MVAIKLVVLFKIEVLVFFVSIANCSKDLLLEWRFNINLHLR
jgi:hypothetical protein